MKLLRLLTKVCGRCRRLICVGILTFLVFMAINQAQFVKLLFPDSSDLFVSSVTRREINANTTFTAPPTVADNFSSQNILITVKTSAKFHSSRLEVILQTWWKLAKNSTFFFTDVPVEPLSYHRVTGGHFINTGCAESHLREALCCKTAVEFLHFVNSGLKWWCHVDDDNYVNVPLLVQLLAKYDSNELWYIGKPSIDRKMTGKVSEKPISFWFATGGAGMCFSKALVNKMKPFMLNGAFVDMCGATRMPDDCTIGYIVNDVLNVTLTVVQGFHSHLSSMELLSRHPLKQQITFSYGRTTDRVNTLQVQGFSEQQDPTRFMSLHCHLFPSDSICVNLSTKVSKQ